MYNMLVDLTQQVMDLKAENVDLKRKNARLIKIEEHQYEINTLEGELENAYAEHDALCQALMNCQINVNIQRAELAQLEDTVCNLRQKLYQLKKSNDRDSGFNPSNFIDRESGSYEPLKTSTPMKRSSGRLDIDFIMDKIRKHHSKLANETSTMDVEFWTYQANDSSSSRFTLSTLETDDETVTDQNSTFQPTVTSTTKKEKNVFRLFKW